MGMLKKGGSVDTSRAAEWFVRWWRDGAKASDIHTLPNPTNPASADPALASRIGWNLDFEWAQPSSSPSLSIQEHMEACIDEHIRERQEEEREGGGMSATQEKKKDSEEMKAKMAKRSLERLATKRGRS